MKNGKTLLVILVMILLPLNFWGQSKIPAFQKSCSPSTEKEENKVYKPIEKRIFKNGDYIIPSRPLSYNGGHYAYHSGTYYFNNGERYSGDFGYQKASVQIRYIWHMSLVFSGHGTYYFLNGDKFEGDWLSNKWNGSGTYYYANGWIYKGIWKEGKVISAGTLISPEKKEIACMNGKIVSSQKSPLSDFSGVNNLVANNDKDEKIKKYDKPDTKESDVDINIPTSKKTAANTFAFIIANEDYKRISHVPYAKNDGKVMSEYCRKTLGVPEKNVHLYENATLGDMRYMIKQINEISAAFNGDASFLIYYAGHGVPSDNMTQSYLLPVDGYGADGSALSLSELYKELGALNTKSIVVFLDACFSGAQRDGKMLATARGVMSQTDSSHTRHTSNCLHINILNNLCDE